MGISTYELNDALTELFTLIDEAMETNCNSYEFCEDIKEKALDMEQWVANNNRATSKQLETVNNWTVGVKKWVRE
jgi:hypothetical protein